MLKNMNGYYFLNILVLHPKVVKGRRLGCFADYGFTELPNVAKMALDRQRMMFIFLTLFKKMVISR